MCEVLGKDLLDFLKLNNNNNNNSKQQLKRNIPGAKLIFIKKKTPKFKYNNINIFNLK